jgi:outer membrane protein assembly factor BamB
MITWCLLVLLCALTTYTFAADAQTTIGYRGDGTNVFPGSKPPTSWDEKTGKNVLWKAALPNWGAGAPIAVKDRVFAMCEPGWKSDWPVLLCLDATDGTVLWRKEINHLPATRLTEAEQKEVATAWHEYLEKYHTAYSIFQEWFYATDRAVANEKFAAAGMALSGWSGGGYGQLRKLRFTDAAWMKTRTTLMAKGGLSGETWEHACGMGTSCVGHAYATPVSDGACVYVATAFGGFACYDLDGNLKWLKFYPGKAGEYCRNGRSPLLYKDLLISDITALARAIDKKTGELKWSSPVDAETILTPVIATVGDRDILLCYNKKAFLLPDGKPLTLDGGSDFGATALVKSDERDVVFFTGGGEHGGWTNKGKTAVMPPACVRFSLEGDTLKGTVLWSGINGQPSSGHAGFVYFDGKLYHPGGVVLEALTGKVLAGTLGRGGAKVTPPTKHHLLVANGYLYGLTGNGAGESEAGRKAPATCTVFTLDGNKVATSTLGLAPVEGDKVEQIKQIVGWKEWGYSYGCPFVIVGDRIYARSQDYLFCIGETK